MVQSQELGVASMLSVSFHFFANPGYDDRGTINTQREGQPPILDIEINDGDIVDLDE